MLIEIHAIQNHSPANLNRDDLGAPKTCYFGGVMRSRISSQCIKRSIRMSEQFDKLLGGVATRRLGQLIAGDGADSKVLSRAKRVLELCGIAPKDKKGGGNNENRHDDESAGRVYTTHEAIRQLSELLKKDGQSDGQLAAQFAAIIARETLVPDMALCGRMLEPTKANKGKNRQSNDAGAAADEGETSKANGVWKGFDLTIEAALQVAHAISTHEARPEVDYFVAADDVPGDDAGAAFVGEAMFASACFYKYFSIDWEQLKKNLRGNEKLAAHTVGAFIRGAALANPTGKQNSFAAHNPPDGMLVEIKKTPVSYANAFAGPVPSKGARDVVSESIARLAQYAFDLDTGYGEPERRFWFSPNSRYPLTVRSDNREINLARDNFKSLEELVVATVSAIGCDWADVQKVAVI